MIQLNNLEKTYQKGKPNECHALKSVNLTIKRGELLAIMGPSGSGKSTLLHILGGLDRFEEGSYRFEDTEISQLSERKLAKFRAAHIGFVLQDYGLLPSETVQSNISTPLYFDKTPFYQIKAVTKKAMIELGISKLAKRDVRDLSGGQKQRVAIARAIVNNPELILADEPTGNLDSITSQKVMNIFLDLNNQGKTVIIVTHNQEIADQCHRIIHIVDGKVSADTPAQNQS